MILKFKSSGDAWTFYDNIVSTRYSDGMIKMSKDRGPVIIEDDLEYTPNIIGYSYADIYIEENLEREFPCLIVRAEIKNKDEWYLFALSNAFILNDEGKTIERISC